MKEQTQKKDLSLIIKENRFILFLSISFLIAIVSLIIRNFLPEEVPIQENTWNGVTPGYSGYEQLVEKMGEPIDSVKTEDGFKLSYQSDFLAIPNEVVTDEEGTVQFIKEIIKYDASHTLDQYVEQYGEPDLVLHDETAGISLRAHVFLQQGLVILAHVEDGSVEGKWYFSPTDRQTFLSSWGENLSEKPTGPEKPF